MSLSDKLSDLGDIRLVHRSDKPCLSRISPYLDNRSELGRAIYNSTSLGISNSRLIWLQAVRTSKDIDKDIVSAGCCPSYGCFAYETVLFFGHHDHHDEESEVRQQDCYDKKSGDHCYDIDGEHRDGEKFSETEYTETEFTENDEPEKTDAKRLKPRTSPRKKFYFYRGNLTGSGGSSNSYGNSQSTHPGDRGEKSNSSSSSNCTNLDRNGDLSIHNRNNLDRNNIHIVKFKCKYRRGIL